MPKKSVKRGEIYYYDFGHSNGSVQGGIRPALVIQGDVANEESKTTIIAAVTTHIRKPYLCSHIRLGSDCGLKKPSMVQLEQIHTVNQSDLLDYIGCIRDPATLRAIISGQKRFFDLFIPKK